MKTRKPPQPVRYSLDNLGNVLREAGTIYRMMRTNKIDHDKGRSLIWVLDKMRSMIEAQHLERLEAKLDALAAQAEATRGIPRISYDANGAQAPGKPH